MTRTGLILIGAMALGGCVSASAPARPNLPIAAENTLRVSINASAARVREVIVSRARARGTVARTPDARSIVLERPIAETAPALLAVCGAHKPGRIVRIIITTDQRGPRTELIERRFLVDTDGGRCAVQLSSEDVVAGNRSLAEIKAQAESQMAGR
jgi:hypothetical protein